MKQAIRCAVLSAVLVFAGQAATIVFVGSLGGANENPANISPATGNAMVTYDSLAHTLLVDVVFSGLTAGNTAAHIHCCVDPPGNTGVATPTPTFPGFPAGMTSGSYNMLFDLTLDSSYNTPFRNANGGAAGAEAALVAGLLGGRAYLNIHSSEFPGGEIRSFLEPVPEPGTIALLCGGLAALTFRRLRPKRS